MVARGDFGVEMPLERVPRVQKNIRAAPAAPVSRDRRDPGPRVVPTEPRPTRAEVSDAANAFDERVDAIMLAGETAAGAFPVAPALTLDAIIRDAEGQPPVRGLVPEGAIETHTSQKSALSDAAVALANRAHAHVICAR